MRYRLPLDTAEANACHRRCEEMRVDDGHNAYVECLETCPGIEVTKNAACNPDVEWDRPPIAACAEMYPPPKAGAYAIVVIAVVVLVLGVGSAILAASVSGS